MEFAKLMNFAESNAGKTTFNASAELDQRTSPSLLLDLRGNSESVAFSPVKPDCVKIHDFHGMSLAYDFLKKRAPERHEFRAYAKAQGATLRTGYRSVSIDTATKIQRMYAFKITGATEEQAMEGDPLEWDDYNKLTFSTDQAIDLWCTLADQRICHVLFSAQLWEKAYPKAKGDKTPIEYQARPLIVGKSALNVVSLMNVVMFLANPSQVTGKLRVDLDLDAVMRKEKVWNVGMLETSRGWFSKNQLTRLKPAAIINPTVSKFLDLMEE